MEAKDSFPSKTSLIKRKLDSIAQERPRKHGKPPPETLAPACRPSQLDWLLTDILCLDPSDTERSGKPLHRGIFTTSFRNAQVSPGATPSLDDFCQLGSLVYPLKDHDRQFSVIKEKFLSGFGSLAKYVSVIGIHECSFKGSYQQVRLDTFRRQVQAVEAARGNASVSYAWHGTNKKGVLDVILHGFGRPGLSKHGAVCGSGVYLVPESKSVLSTSYSDVDENGARYTLLCKVLMGDVERIHEGFQHSLPISEDYVIGIDDATHQSRYVVRSTHVNSHILPHFIVGFTLALPLYACVMDIRSRVDTSTACQSDNEHLMRVQGKEDSFPSEETSYAEVDELIQNGATGDGKLSVDSHHKTPRSPWLSFPALFSKMRRRLSPGALAALHQLHRDFKVGRIPRKVLIRWVRAVAGDAMLRECIMGKSRHSHVALAVNEEGYDSS